MGGSEWEEVNEEGVEEERVNGSEREEVNEEGVNGRK